MSETTAVASPLQQIANFFKLQVATMAGDEIIAVAPAITAFLTWVNQNPQGALNPAAIGPQIVLLQASVLAAQGTATSAIITSFSGQLLTAINAWAAAAKAAQTAGNIGETSGVTGGVG